jgi:hypothetical protein
MIGLGVLATGSGATALTGATLSNTVSPSADFRVNVDTPGLEVVRGPAFDTSDQEVTVTDKEGVVADATATYFHGGSPDDNAGLGATTALDDADGFAAAATTGTNGDLNFGITIPFDKIPAIGPETSVGQDVEFVFPDLLQINNRGFFTGSIQGEGNNPTAVGIRYDSGDGNSASTSENGYVTVDSAAIDGDGGTVTEDGSGDSLSFDNVASMFGFFAKTEADLGGTNDTKISSQGIDQTSAENGAQKPTSGLKIPNETGMPIDLHVKMNPTLGDDLVETFKETSILESGGQVRLIDEIFVSVMDSQATDVVDNFEPAEPDEQITLS